MFGLLKKAVVKQSIDEDPDEGIKDLVELALKKLVIQRFLITLKHKIPPEIFKLSLEKD